MYSGFVQQGTQYSEWPFIDTFKKKNQNMLRNLTLRRKVKSVFSPLIVTFFFGNLHVHQAGFGNHTSFIGFGCSCLSMVESLRELLNVLEHKWFYLKIWFQLNADEC